MSEFEDGENDYGDAGDGAADDPFSDLERVTDDEEDDDGEDLMENREMYASARSTHTHTHTHILPAPIFHPQLPLCFDARAF